MRKRSCSTVQLLQVLAAGGHSATSPVSPARPPDSDSASLIEELDRSLSDIQQACHSEPSPDGEAALACHERARCTQQTEMLLIGPCGSVTTLPPGFISNGPRQPSETVEAWP